MNEPAPLSYGQLSVWRDVRELSRGRWHEANTQTFWPLAEDAEYGAAEVENAVLTLVGRHESLRTAYVLTDPFAPAQRVLPFLERVDRGVVECGPHEFDDVVARLAAEPFDLRAAPSWRFRVLTHGGRPRVVVLVQHHITADGWSNGILEADFRTALCASAPAAAAPVSTPRGLAAWQRSEARHARRAALTAYWERIFGLTTASLAGVGPPAPPDTACQYSVRSRQVYSGCRRLAERLSVPVSSVVLAAFARSVEHAAGPGSLVAQLMSSNRFVPPWNTVVSSMNQWTAASVSPAPDDFAAYVGHVNTQSLLAYRYGMYDVDEIDLLRDKVRAGREPYEASLGFNFLTGSAPPTGTTPESDTLRESPFSRIGHPCYLRATDEGGESLHLRLRTMGLADSLTRDLLEGTVARLTDAAA
ncbi:condensation domain-containing protein [Streptomyces sp. SM10]|uniref:condensation domain-containing protein n=1 Tax=Streptomyces sp. SM10 TaxID=565556 RepID=UPI000CD4C667|nr:condensation domain-containing protein [Streptomyces sp. SM10]